MLRRFVLLLWIAPLLTWASTAAQPARPSGYPPELPWPAFPQILFQRGDDPRWAEKDFDDSGWKKIEGRELPSRDGIYWVRWRVRQSESRYFRPRDGFLLKVVASYDVYWDGHVVGRNGRVSAQEEDEGPGVVDALFQIPPDLLGAGEHVVALRMSSWKTGFRSPTYSLLFELGNFRTMLLTRSRTAILSVMAVGAALVGAMVFGLLWLLAGRRRPLLLFSLLFLCVGVMQALQAWRWLYDYPYSWHQPRLVVITSLVTAMAVLLPAFVLDHFQLKRRRWFFGVLAVLVTGAWFVSPIYNLIGLALCAVGFSIALALALHALWLRRRGAGFACVGLGTSVVALIMAPRDFLDHAFFISAGPAIVGLLVVAVLQLRDERREAQQAVLTAARLEIELLKKNIQPHFLLNTLATIMEVIEREPKTAVTMIEALATEFRILARVSGEKLIPLAQEMDLCRAHLRVMSLRKGAQCALEVSGAVDTAQVPPAMFHTLIENGLTHLLPRAGRHDFELRVESRPSALRFSLVARGERQANPATGTAPDGTGMRYIKARLEESFTGRWSIAGGPVPEGWETVIEIGAATVLTRSDSKLRPRAVAVPGGQLA